MVKRILQFGVVAAIAATMVAIPTRATSVPQQQLDFSGGSGGSLSYTLGSSPTSGNDLTITNALITSLLAIPANKSVAITGGALNITTANCVKGCQATALAGGGAMSSPTFNYGGTLTLTGEIKGLTSPATLLAGTFSPTSNPQAGQAKPVQPNATLNSHTGNGGFDGSLAITTINPQIYTDLLPLIFQVPSSTGKGYISEIFVNLAFSPTSAVINHTFTSGTWSGSVKSTDVIVKPVPEPMSLVLFGTVLLAGASLVRRKTLRIV